MVGSVEPGEDLLSALHRELTFGVARRHQQPITLSAEHATHPWLTPADAADSTAQTIHAWAEAFPKSQCRTPLTDA